MSLRISRIGREPAHEMTPERLYDRQWAVTLLGRVLDRLAAEMDGAGKGPLFARLEFTLRGERGAATYARLYHSVALLLPDATVMTAGSNPTRGTYEKHIEIWTPPYLFTTDGSGNGRSPTVTIIPL